MSSNLLIGCLLAKCGVVEFGLTQTQVYLKISIFSTINFDVKGLFPNTTMFPSSLITLLYSLNNFFVSTAQSQLHFVILYGGSVTIKSIYLSPIFFKTSKQSPHIFTLYNYIPPDEVESQPLTVLTVLEYVNVRYNLSDNSALEASIV